MNLPPQIPPPGYLSAPTTLSHVFAAGMDQQVPFPSRSTLSESLAHLSLGAAGTGKGYTKPWVHRAGGHLGGTEGNPT